MSRFSPANMHWPDTSSGIHYNWIDEVEDGEPTWNFWEAFGEDNRLVYSSETGGVTQFTKAEATRPLSYQPFEDGYDGEEVLPEGPMRSFYWPLGTLLSLGDEDRTASAMRDLSVCLVKVDDTYGIALTGGGMDLSWHLAAAAVAAGFLPWTGLSLDNWEYGISTVGEAWAKRVRLAVKYRLQAERRNAARKLADIERNWR